MAPAVRSGDAQELYCPHCGRRGDILSPGLLVCGHCGVVPNLAARPISSISPGPAPAATLERPRLHLVDSRSHVNASRSPTTRSQPRTGHPRKYGCHDCPPSCNFLSCFREALREWRSEHQGQRPTAQAIAGKLDYTDRQLRRLRKRHGFGRWPPPKSF